MLIDAQIGRRYVEVKTATKSLNGICPHCKQGKLIRLVQFDKRGPPPEWQKRLEKAQMQSATL